jgi:anti-sigma factor RsiW
MNDCSQTKTLLMLAADGELDAEQAGWLERHVGSCPACQLEQARFRELDRDFGTYGDFLERIAPVAMPRRQFPVLARWVPVMAAGLAALLFLGVILIHRLSPVGSSEVSQESFVPIPYVLPLDPYESATVMRMEVPVAALIAIGYKVDMTDPTAVVSADVLVGEDGRAHAVHVLSGLVLN